jgi:hypothetical protein
MGIIKTLRRQGSELSKYDGKTPPEAVFPDPLDSSRSDLSAYKGNTPPPSLLTTDQSPLLYPYSITGEARDQVQFEYSLYPNGSTNVLPLPTQLGVNIYDTPLSYFYGGTEGYYPKTAGVGENPSGQTLSDGTLENRLTIAYTAKIANQELGNLAINPFGVSNTTPPNILLEYNSPITSPSDPSLEFVRIQNPTIRLKDLYDDGETRTKNIYDNPHYTSVLKNQKFVSRKDSVWIYNPTYSGVSLQYALLDGIIPPSEEEALFTNNISNILDRDITTIFNKPRISKVAIDYTSTTPNDLGYLMPKKSLGGIQVDNWDVPNIMAIGATQMYVELYKEKGLPESAAFRILETEPKKIVNQNSATSPIQYPVYVDEEPGRKNQSTQLSSLNPVYTSLVSSLTNNLTSNDPGFNSEASTTSILTEVPEPYPNISWFNRETTYKTSGTIKERGFTRQNNSSILSDELNRSPILQQNNPDNLIREIDNKTIEENKNTDLIKFFFEINNNDSTDQNWFLFFRAYINDLSDNFQANWDPFKYVGRGENFYKYNGFSRDVTLTFTIYANSRAEMIPIYEKLNYLVGTLAPDYSQIGFMRGNFVNLTIGDYFTNTPSIIKSITLNPSFDAGWDINRYAVYTYVKDGKLTDKGIVEEVGNPLTLQNDDEIYGNYFVGQLPRMIDVTLSFVPIHSFTPQFKKNFIRNVGSPSPSVGTPPPSSLKKAKPITPPPTFTPPTLLPYAPATQPGFTRALNDVLNPTQPGSGVLAQPTVPLANP